jgi:phosphonate transport system ATP-binding protein
LADDNGDMTSSALPILSLERVSKDFGSRHALRTVSLSVHPGECVAVIGRSGAGKTTFLRCLACFTPVTAGAIRFRGQNLATLAGAGLRAHRCRVGMIYQQFNLVRRLSVLYNVLVGRLSHLSPAARWAALAYRFPARDRDIALRCLDHVGLLDRAWQRTDTLSGGEQQRVAIAKILAQEPELILADEPIASLDLLNGELVMGTLRAIAHDAGLPVVATLHHVDFARRYADRVLGFQSGQLIFDGPAADLTDGVLQQIFGDRVAAETSPLPVAVGALELVPS